MSPSCEIGKGEGKGRERNANKTSGPEVESWFGVEEGVDPAIDNEWPLLPFMALSDGAHVYVPFPFLLITQVKEVGKTELTT